MELGSLMNKPERLNSGVDRAATGSQVGSGMFVETPRFEFGLFAPERGQVSEPPASAPVRVERWKFSFDRRPEDLQVFESEVEMRVGVRNYNDQQLDQIRRATAERDLPDAPPIPLDD